MDRGQRGGKGLDARRGSDEAPRPTPRRRRRGLGSLSRFQLLLLVGLLIASAAAAAVALELSRDQADSKRLEQIERAESSLGQQLVQAQGALLGVRGLFAADRDVTQPEFARFAAPSLGRSGLQGLISAVPVRRDERVAFEQATGQQIKSLVLLPEPGLRPAPAKDLYHPVLLLAPFPKEARGLIGVDLSVIPGVPQALVAARDGGRTVAAPPFSLGSESPGLILVRARYRAGSVLRTVAGRREAVEGYTAAFYRADGFAHAALAALAPGARLQIFDGEVQLFGEPGTEPGGAERIVDIGGRQWRLHLDVASEPSLALPATILGAGMLLTALVALLFVAGNRRERELSEAEREVRRQVSVNRALLDAAPDGIRLADLHGEVLLENPAMVRLLETLGAAPPGGNLYDRAEASAALCADPAGFLAIASALRANPALTREDEFELVSGQVVRQFSAPVRIGSDDDPIAARIFVVRDVTVERRMERVKDEFVALASHELRTPLTSILGYLEALRDGAVGEVAPQQARFLDVIERNGERLRRLVDDLLDVARADAGRLGLAMDEVDLAAVVGDCVQAARPAAAEKGIELRSHGDDALPVLGDQTRLAQVLDNLVSNALKFTPVGGTVAIRAWARGDEVLCEVSDSGPGIPPSEQERLFERFYRGSQATDDAVQGTGLGLAITKMIVEAHGGRIDLDSEEGRGTRARFAIPAASTAPSSGAGVPASAAGSAVS